MNQNLPINQHYVPQFLLKKFSIPKKSHVYVFDKKEGKQFRSSVRNVGAENRFYNFEHEGNQYSLEPILSKIEGQAGSIIKKIIKEKSIGNLCQGSGPFPTQGH